MFLFLFNRGYPCSGVSDGAAAGKGVAAVHTVSLSLLPQTEHQPWQTGWSDHSTLVWWWWCSKSNNTEAVHFSFSFSFMKTMAPGGTRPIALCWLASLLQRSFLALSLFLLCLFTFKLEPGKRKKKGRGQSERERRTQCCYEPKVGNENTR